MDASVVIYRTWEHVWQHVGWVLIPIAEAAVVASIIFRGVVRDFSVFAIYLVADILLAVICWWVVGESAAYRALVTPQSLLLILQILIVLDFYRLLYRADPGIHAFARVLIIAAVIVAIAVTFGNLLLDLPRIVWPAPIVQRLLVLKRVVPPLLGLLLFTTMAFFPKAPSARNILLHGWLLTVLFIAAAMGFFGPDFGQGGPLMGPIQLCCFVTWAIALRPPYATDKRSAEMVRTER